MMLPLFVSDVPMQCINQAAIVYHVPAKLIISILNIERGKIGLASKNKNGSYDLGPMQINTCWWPTLYHYGISPQQVKNDACTNVKVGTWILSKAIANSTDLNSGIGYYHSHTSHLNQRYVQQVRIKYTKLAKFLLANLNNVTTSLP